MNETKKELEQLGHRPMSPRNAIEAKCQWCSHGIRVEVVDCLVRDCPLYPFRLGVNPWAKPRSEKQLAVTANLTRTRKNEPTLDEFEAAA